MQISVRDHFQAGAAMMGPDGEAYFVPDKVEVAFRISGSLGSQTMPGPGKVSADMKIRTGVRGGMEYLPQMGNVMC